MSVSPFLNWSPFKKYDDQYKSICEGRSKVSAKVAHRSSGGETTEVTKLGGNDLMVELKSNDQTKKLGAIATFLDISMTVSPHTSLNNST
ncbi:hypothetical protein PoB_003341500 [Plakobranchus ocellatus]|uniref:Uncharacterized protein n=1 Tax=Plakobranchus ocellatus TaxID=259542 RepID=A0AAV4AFH1_9GAST|nr:hypothetical protein PoB_003341500 [Plakobranchus ocellatus]